MSVHLPTGLVRLESGQVVKEPNREVQDRIELILQTLLEKKSLSKVVRHLHERCLKIPRRDKWGDTHWKQPTVCAVRRVATNPAYAGAYVWGRTREVKSKNTGRKVQTRLPQPQWRVCLRDKYPAYISWEDFEKIQAMLKDNYAEYRRRQTRGLAREGEALLQGIVYCGACGHKLVVKYKHGAYYVCNYFETQAGEPACQHVPAGLLDAQVVRWFFEALSVAQIDLSARVLADADRTREQVLAARRQEVERLRYQENLARRQFHKADPDNRLVTAELERRWEEALRTCREAEERLRQDEAHAPCLAIPADLLEQLKNLGPHLPELWECKLLKSSQKKSLLRTLIDKVVLQRVATDKVKVRVVWRGGQTTAADVRVSVSSFTRLSDLKELKEMALRLACEGQTDEQIAAALTAKGHRAPDAGPIRASSVRKLRWANRALHFPQKSNPPRKAGYLTLSQVAERLNIRTDRLYYYIHEGKLAVKKDGTLNCYLIPDKPSTVRQIGQLLAGQIERLAF